ncbi:MAG TPA: helix-turn-helix domain-containing protein [Candidatus Limnocylindria bacterium]|nr:helix-turn-helix domain-containing protein [Candidatus Limnocylindria bacterium]
MAPPRTRPVDLALVRLRQQLHRLGQDVRSLRLGVGWTQATLAQRAGVSQASIARFEGGDTRLALAIPVRVFAALGYDLPMRVYPADGVSLKDSGQLALAEEVRSRAHPSLRVLFEEPTGEGRQAADVVLVGESAVTHLELESGLSDFEGQLRRGRLKRDALQQRYGRSVAFVLALRDTDRNRAAVAAHRAVVRAALPAASREVLEAITTGRPLNRDGLLWLRRPVTRGNSDSLKTVRSGLRSSSFPRGSAQEWLPPTSSPHSPKTPTRPMRERTFSSE